MSFWGAKVARIFWQKVEEGYGAGLNMTRSIGDLEAHRETGLIADPEVSVHQVGGNLGGSFCP